MGNRLFITYAWEDNTDGDFDYIAQQLRKAGLEVEFDRVALVPGHRLWEQIETRIASGDIEAWGYLLTSGSLASERCKEEYYLALNRALETRGAAFPLIGLFFGVDINSVPPGLRLRLGVPLADRNWVERVVAAVEGRVPRVEQADLAPIAVVWHQVPSGKRVLEIRPRLGLVPHWRAYIPLAFKDSLTGYTEGQSGTPSRDTLFYGFDRCEDQYRCIGAPGPIGAGISAYLWFSVPTPDHVLFQDRDGQKLRIPST